VVGLSSFEGIAGMGERFVVVGDARRGSFALQEMLGGRLLGEVRMLAEGELEGELWAAKERGEELVSFDEAGRFPVGEELGRMIRRVRGEARELGRAYLGRGCEERTGLEGGALEPLYLRPPHITKSKKESLF
ncbi:MAG: hypothetical protein AAGC74_08820, partial [Verrucomicrobiota bacterium]